MARIVGWTLFLTAAAMVAAAAIFAQELRDWWFLRSYEPSAEIAALADKATFTDTGRNNFYMSDPQINDKAEFNQNCTTLEESLVLGCYRGQRIFILQVEREELEGIMEVTAAHEMLHAAYDRLPESEREKIVDWLEADFAQVDDPVVEDLIERYEERGGQTAREDELHSVMPTQVAELSDELEQYYERYFDDRSQVIELYQSYEQTFQATRDEIERLDVEITALRNDIEDYEARIDSKRQDIRDIEARLESLEADGDFQRYNELVPEQNQAVQSYNQLIEQYRDIIARHNRKVDELNDAVLVRQDLVDSIDSTVEEL